MSTDSKNSALSNRSAIKRHQNRIPDPSSVRLIPPRCMSLFLLLKVHRQLPISTNIFRCISTSQMSSRNSAPRPNTTANAKPSPKNPSNKNSSNNQSKMGKKKSNTPGEEHLLLPPPPSSLGIVDTHTHIATTYSFYRQRYKEGKYENVFDFIKAMYEGRNVEAVVDVWCEAPVQKLWKTFADSALTPEDRQSHWGGIDYWFAMGELAVFNGCCDADTVCSRRPSVSRISLSDLT